MRPLARFGFLVVFVTLTLLVGTPWQWAADSAHTHGTSGMLLSARTALAQVSWFVSTFDGAPAAPQPWTPSTWDVAVHSRDHQTWDALEPMQAAHSGSCGAPPATHTISAYQDAVYQCNDHIMTAINASDYGMIYLTPNQLVDFSGGGAIVRFDMSTLRASGRDFVDLWISPYNEHLQLPLRDDLPDAQGEPRNAVHIEMDFGMTGTFQARIIRNFVATKLDGAGIDPWTGYESFLVPSASRRDTFELQITRTHLRFGMPAYNQWWIDKPIADLGWDKGVVQFGHHSYNPQKDCEPTSPCLPNTWHWDNVVVYPAAPFTILRANRRYVGPGTPSTVTFPAPAPTGSRLQFAGIGNALEISTNGGASWQPAVRQTEELNVEEHFKTYWTTIPTGTTSVQIRGQNWWGGTWRARDISIWSLTTAGGPPAPTPTPLPVVCSPRPPVTTSIVKEGSGVLRATIVATGTNNTIRRLDFAPTNAIVRGTGLPDQTGAFSTTPQTASSTFQILQRTPGAASVRLTVTDGCGTWQTFAGGGASAF